MKSFLIGALAAVAVAQCFGQIYDTNNPVVETFAGSGQFGHLDGQGVSASFSYPAKVVADTLSNVFVLDQSNYRIRRITPDGTVSTFAGGGSVRTNGYGTNVALNIGCFGCGDTYMTIDHSNTVWVISGNNFGSAWYLTSINADSYVSQMQFTMPGGEAHAICVDSTNNLYIASRNRIYRCAITNGTNVGLTPLTGNSFSLVYAMTTDQVDNIYVFDAFNWLIRKVSQTGSVITFAGSGTNTNLDGIGSTASFSWVYGMCSDNAGNLYLACDTAIRKITPNTSVITIAGNFAADAYLDGPCDQAAFQWANDVCVSQNMLFVADVLNQRIRRISFAAQQVSPPGLAVGLYPGLHLSGLVGRTYDIQSSTNLATWRTEAIVVLPSSPYFWVDQTAGAAAKFYRAYMLP